jgi:hypothetical protein
MADDQAGAQWYYAEGGKSVGPIAEGVFDAMAADGRIAADALVWREGMEGWKPLRDVRAAAPTVQGAPPETCSQCGRPFPASDLIRFGETHVCAACKPAFVQRLQEDAEVPAALVYGGFWIRVAATFIDKIAVSLLTVPLSIAMNYFVRVMLNGETINDGQISTFLGVIMLGVLLSMAIPAAYEIFLVGKYGRTLGKMHGVCRILSKARAGMGMGDLAGHSSATLLRFRA